MRSRDLGTLVLMRHGDTRYTDVYPDLTPEGVEEVARAARRIREIVSIYPSVTVRFSPWARTRGTADIVARELGACATAECPEIAGVYPLLETWITFDSGKCGEYHYANDPTYDDPAVWNETRAQTRERFLAHFARFVRFALDSEAPVCEVHVTHFEMIHHLIDAAYSPDLDRDEPFRKGEYAIVRLRETSPDEVALTVSYRGEERRLRWRVSESALVA